MYIEVKFPNGGGTVTVNGDIVCSDAQSGVVVIGPEPYSINDAVCSDGVEIKEITI